MKTPSTNLRPPFALLRQAISHGKFEDKETRERINGLLDDMETELDNSSFEFSVHATIESIEALQTHLVELLLVEEEEEEVIEKKSSPSVSVSGGDLDDDDEDNG